MVIIACDPGTKHTALAALNGKAVDYCKINPTLPKLQAFFKQYQDEGFIFAIEDQYLHLNPNTLKKLVEIRTLISTVARLYGAKQYFLIPPQKWQRIILGVNIKAKREQRKRVSCMVASSIANQEIKDNDIADAICIGNYIQRQNICKGGL